MYRPWWERTFAAVLALWFVCIVTEPLPLHRCPMHDGVYGAVPTAAQPHHHHHMAGAHGGAGQHDQAHHQCTCLGDCTGASPASPASAVAFSGSSTRIVQTIAASSTVARPHAPDFTLPFAIGPPPLRS
jgi:hypothetical protein